MPPQGRGWSPTGVQKGRQLEISAAVPIHEKRVHQHVETKSDTPLAVHFRDPKQRGYTKTKPNQLGNKLNCDRPEIRPHWFVFRGDPLGNVVSVRFVSVGRPRVRELTNRPADVDNNRLTIT